MGHRDYKKCYQCANIINNNVGGGVFIPQITKIKAYYSHGGPLPISLILSFAMTSNKALKAPLVLWAIVSSSYFRHDQVYDVLEGVRLHQNFRGSVTNNGYKGNFIFVVPCVVNLG